MRGARLVDRYGLPLSTGSAPAAEAYVEGVDRMLSANPGAEGCFERAIAIDEGFALAHGAQGRSLQMRGQVPEAKVAAARARSCAMGATRRERQHVEALALGIDGDAGGALDAVRAHTGEFPRDAVVLSLATGVFGLIGFSGRLRWPEELLALLDGVAGHYGDDWWFLGAHAFAHTEAGRPEVGRRLAERSLALRARNANAAHALVHVFFEAGDGAGGAAFVEPWLAQYEPAAPLHCHLSWHLALFELALSRPARALALYALSIGPGASQAAPLITLSDAASLLWRCELYGEAPAPLPWSAVRGHAARAFPRAGVAFVDAHCALAFAAGGDREALDRRLRELEDAETRGGAPAGGVVPALARGLDAFARGDYAEAVRRLAPVADQIVRIGGSHAQRELFEDTLVVAYLRAGRFAEGEALLRQRLARRPSERDAAWLARARAGRVEPARTHS